MLYYDGNKITISLYKMNLITRAGMSIPTHQKKKVLNSNQYLNFIDLTQIFDNFFIYFFFLFITHIIKCLRELLKLSRVEVQCCFTKSQIHSSAYNWIKLQKFVLMTIETFTNIKINFLIYLAVLLFWLNMIKSTAGYFKMS